MDIETLSRLLTTEGTAAIAAAVKLSPSLATYPACSDRLVKRFPSAIVRAALDTVLLRDKARPKFSRADSMFFCREALEMATSEPVASYRSERYSRFESVIDLCCGIGGDAIALARTCPSVTAVDRDVVRLRMAEANVAAYGLRADFLNADVLIGTLPAAAAAFADPGRRADGRRVLSVNDYEPPVRSILARFQSGFPVGIKVAPGVPRDDVRSFDAEAEFISFGGELKECVLWFGPLRSCRLRATVLPGPHTLSVEEPVPVMRAGEPSQYLYDPDPSISRAGLTPSLSEIIGGYAIDSQIALIASDNLCPTPFASIYRIEDVVPFHVKRIGEWLRARSVGRVTLLKRGASVDVDEMRSQWRLRGEEHRVVIFTKAHGRPIVLIGDRVA